MEAKGARGTEKPNPAPAQPEMAEGRPYFRRKLLVGMVIMEAETVSRHEILHNQTHTDQRHQHFARASGQYGGHIGRRITKLQQKARRMLK